MTRETKVNGKRAMEDLSRGPSPWIFVALIILVLLGFFSSVYIAKSHYSVLLGKSSGPSFCSVSEVVDCDAVAASPYSEIYQMPWASFGALIYLILLSFAILGLAYKPLSRFSLRFMFFISVLCLGFDVYLAFIGFVILKLVCIVCIFTYLVNLGILVVSKLSLKEGTIEVLKNIRRTLPFLDKSLGPQRPMARLFFSLILVIALFGVGTIVGIRFHFVGDREERVAKLLEALRQQKPASISLEGAPRLGPQKARITIVEFSDFQCPYCKEFASALKMVQKRYPKDIALYFKHYPLDNSCNPYIQRPFHQEACKLSHIGVCLQEKGLFWEMDEGLFSTKGSEALIKDLLATKGMNFDTIIACSMESQTRERVLKDIHEARQAGVRATPTVFINGYRLEGAFDTLTLSLLVERLLSSGPDETKSKGPN